MNNILSLPFFQQKRKLRIFISNTFFPPKEGEVSLFEAICCIGSLFVCLPLSLSLSFSLFLSLPLSLSLPISLSLPLSPSCFVYMSVCVFCLYLYEYVSCFVCLSLYCLSCLPSILQSLLLRQCMCVHGDEICSVCQLYLRRDFNIIVCT